MIKKMIVLIAAVLAFTVVADYFGIIHIKVAQGNPMVLKSASEYGLKPLKDIAPNPF